MFTNHIYLIYMYIQDLALNNLQGLICHKTQQTTNQPTNQQRVHIITRPASVTWFTRHRLKTNKKIVKLLTHPSIYLSIYLVLLHCYSLFFFLFFLLFSIDCHGNLTTFSPKRCEPRIRPFQCTEVLAVCQSITTVVSIFANSQLCHGLRDIHIDSQVEM